jgi:hypothetical protein
MSRLIAFSCSEWTPESTGTFLFKYNGFIKHFYTIASITYKLTYRSIDLSTDPGLKSYLIAFPCSEWSPDSTRTIIKQSIMSMLYTLMTIKYFARNSYKLDL